MALYAEDYGDEDDTQDFGPAAIEPTRGLSERLQEMADTARNIGKGGPRKDARRFAAIARAASFAASVEMISDQTAAGRGLLQIEAAAEVGNRDAVIQLIDGLPAAIRAEAEAEYQRYAARIARMYGKR